MIIVVIVVIVAAVGVAVAVGVVSGVVIGVPLALSKLPCRCVQVASNRPTDPVAEFLSRFSKEKTAHRSS